MNASLKKPLSIIEQNFQSERKSSSTQINPYLATLLKSVDKNQKNVLSCEVSVSTLNSVPIICHYSIEPEVIKFIIFWEDHAINADVHNLKSEFNTACDRFVIASPSLIEITESSGSKITINLNY